METFKRKDSLPLDFRRLDLSHVAQVQGLCAQLYPRMTPAALDHTMGQNQTILHNADQTGLILTGAFAHGSDFLLAYATLDSREVLLQDGERFADDGADQQEQMWIGNRAITRDYQATLRSSAHDVFRHAGGEAGDAVVWVLQMVVDAPFRRRGIGAQLLQYINDCGSDSGFKFSRLACDATHTAACAMYRSAGFTRYAQSSLLVSRIGVRRDGNSGSGSSSVDIDGLCSLAAAAEAVATAAAPAVAAATAAAAAAAAIGVMDWPTVRAGQPATTAADLSRGTPVMYAFRNLSGKHLPRVKELCRQLHPMMSTAQLDLESAVYTFATEVRGYGLIWYGAFQGDTDVPAAYVAAQCHSATMENSDVMDSDAQLLDAERSSTTSNMVTMKDCEARRGALIRAGARPGDGVFCLRHLAVDAGQRGRGLGRALLQRVLEHAAETGAAFVYLRPPATDESAVYESAGFALWSVGGRDFLVLQVGPSGGAVDTKPASSVAQPHASGQAPQRAAGGAGSGAGKIGGSGSAWGSSFSRKGRSSTGVKAQGGMAAGAATAATAGGARCGLAGSRGPRLLQPPMLRALATQRGVHTSPGCHSALSRLM